MSLKERRIKRLQYFLNSDFKVDCSYTEAQRIWNRIEALLKIEEQLTMGSPDYGREEYLCR